MSYFRFQVQKETNVSDIEQEARNQAEAMIILQRKGFLILKYIGEYSLPNKENQSFKTFFDNGKFNAYDFIEQLAPLMAARLPLERALGVIEEGVEKTSAFRVIHTLRIGLHEGKKFADLIRMQGNYFPPIFSAMIETGQETGSLPEVTKELQRFMKESKELRDFIITSSIYPAIIILISGIMVILLFTVFIPRFSKIFKTAGKALPWLTQLMLDISEVMKSTWWFWPILVIILIFLYKKSKEDSKFKQYRDHLMLRIPLLGSIIKEIQVCRFIRTLAIMNKNNVPILRSIQISSKILENSVIAESFSTTSSDLRSGNKLSDTLGKSPYMPRGAASMLRISEESGNIAEMLQDISDMSENRVRTKIKRFLAILEPAIIIILAVIVAIVILSIFMAIMEMNSLKK